MKTPKDTRIFIEETVYDSLPNNAEKKADDSRSLDELFDPKIAEIKCELGRTYERTKEIIYDSYDFMNMVMGDENYTKDSKEIAQKAVLQLKGMICLIEENTLDHNTSKEVRDTIEINLKDIKKYNRGILNAELLDHFRKARKILEE